MMKFLDFAGKTPTSFQTAQEMKRVLLENGATELFEDREWELQYGETYFVIRNDSAILAFSVPDKASDFRVFAAHGDSPTLKLKENPEMSVENLYVKLNVERYGGLILNTWLDRPLSLAGRILFRTEQGIGRRFINIDRDLFVIPNVAIHMNREINDGFRYDPQRDMLPLFGDISSKGKLRKLIAAEADVPEEDILGHDLYLYNRTAPMVFGPHGEYFSAPRIDDTECACAGFYGFLQGERKKHAGIFAMFDNEEVGNDTRQGAGSTLLRDVLVRIAEGFSLSRSRMQQWIAGSFMLSADNGHAVHPNHPEYCDPTNRPVMNGGILLKYAASQTYTTDGLSGAHLKELCREAGVPFQIFFNRSDLRGGGTLGNTSSTKVPFMTADIGLAQLAMHSSYETAGVKDYTYMEQLAKTLFA